MLESMGTRFLTRVNLFDLPDVISGVPAGPVRRPIAAASATASAPLSLRPSDVIVFSPSARSSSISRPANAGIDGDALLDEDHLI
jgi:hypothetical protein